MAPMAMQQTELQGSQATGMLAPVLEGLMLVADSDTAILKMDILCMPREGWD